jgi:hypothetical protein
MSPGPAENSTRSAEPLNRREQLRAEQLLQRIAGRNRNKADLLVYRGKAGPIAVKDYAPRPWWIRQTIGRLLVRREARAYRAAAGARGLPGFLGRLGPWALATEFVEARTLAEFEDGSVDPAIFDELQEHLAGLHQRGIALADLNHRDVLLTDTGEVFIVDLATAWLLGRRPGPLRRRLFEHFRRADLFSLARLRCRFTGEDRDAALRAADPRTVRLHRIARRIKWRWDRLRGAERVPPVDDHWR